MNDKISIFAYGSLLNQVSLKQTTPSFSHYFTAALPGYRRVFNYESPYRKDSITGAPSSVLNLVKDDKAITNGMCFIADRESLDELYERENGYSFEMVRVFDDREAPHDVHTFIAYEHAKYDFVTNSFEQDQYVAMCVAGAKKFGKHFYNQFLNTTYIGDETLFSRISH
mgnify:CR=1 FL=1